MVSADLCVFKGITGYKYLQAKHVQTVILNAIPFRLAFLIGGSKATRYGPNCDSCIVTSRFQLFLVVGRYKEKTSQKLS